MFRFWWVKRICEWLTITDAIARLRRDDAFMAERLYERDITVRKLVAQVNYLTQLTQRWTREYPVLGKIEAKHLSEEKARRTRALERAAKEAQIAATLPHGGPPTEENDGRQEDDAGQSEA